MIFTMETLLSRTRKLNEKPVQSGAIVYWMNREMRIEDNWALLYAQQQALKHSQPLIIIFSLFQSFETAKNTPEDKMFMRMKQGLKLVDEQARKRAIPFIMLPGDTVQAILKFLSTIGAGLLVCDFSPLKAMRALREAIASKSTIRMEEVDAHNIIPVWVASDKQEWGAYTLRPKINRLLKTYLIPFPKVLHQTKTIRYDGPNINTWLASDTPSWLTPVQASDEFITKRLVRYSFRNDPNEDATSRLSSYFHFGHLASQTIALRVQATAHPDASFLEELIVRKELADNFCFYNPHYDSIQGFPNWAIKTLNQHAKDKREYLYSYEQFAQAKTHDDAWNACQMQMVKIGYMHGYMRMYWAKKILEWTVSAEEALAIANRLNDTYELDGRDPNGYTGTAWAIGGVHDRPWQERPIFGMIRYMNAQGLKRKFDIGNYIQTWLGTSIIK